MSALKKRRCQSHCAMPSCYLALAHHHRLPEQWRAPCRYENLVQVRCLLEGMSEADILHNWQTILPDSMQRWHLDRQEVRRLSTPFRTCSRGPNRAPLHLYSS